jgi:NAD(P)-dependent dehydrogenase (short-subunit alcohol dehydrogenase family)
MGVNRLGETEDIANVAWFLLSEQSGYMTGECLAVVGKPLMRLWEK